MAHGDEDHSIETSHIPEDVATRDFLHDAPHRDEVLVSVGLTLYVAASPDILDGLSDQEFNTLVASGDFMRVYEILGRLGVQEDYRLPDGFSDHFKNEVVPDIKVIRSDPILADVFRTELRAILNDYNAVKMLYRAGGNTYSEIASRISKSNRVGTFYSQQKAEQSLHTKTFSGAPQASARYHYSDRRRKKKKVTKGDV